MNFLKNIFFRLSGTSAAQPLFEKLYKFTLIGMNYGNGGGVLESGEINVIRYVKSKCGSNPIIFDVGANEGQFAHGVLNTLGDNCQLFSFEPSAKTFAGLSKSLQNSQVKLHQLGFGFTDESVFLYKNPQNSEMSSVYNRQLEHAGIEMSEKETINIRSIDSFCEEHNINQIDLLKLDIEGHELSALKGASNMIANKKIKFIQFEFGGTNIDSRTYFQDFWYLLNKDYKLYRVLKYGLHPIVDYRETFEIFTTINYLAELRD